VNACSRLQDAAVLVPELCIAAHLRVAKQHGAELRFNEPLATWTELTKQITSEEGGSLGDEKGGENGEGGFEVVTSSGHRFTCAQLVLSVGAWASSVWAEQALPEVQIGTFEKKEFFCCAAALLTASFCYFLSVCM